MPRISPASLFIFGFEGKRPPPPLLDRLRDGRLGGVILFSRNIESSADGHDVAEVRALCQAFHDASPTLPPIVSVDQEGGRVQRLRAPLTVFPEMAALMGREEELAAGVGRALGEELSSLGFNLNYAPVLDVRTNPENTVIGDRALGETPDEVVRLALPLLDGMEGAGVRGCGKHFPGHGDTLLDSHHGLPRMGAGRQRLWAVEIVPFREAVRHGIGMIMSAHVVYPQVDARPATLSRVWLGEVLRRELCFSGVIVSDDMDMAAVAGGDAGEVVVEALMAGCDAFLFCRDAARQQAAEEALIRESERDSRVRARIEESARRLLAFRKTLCRPRQPPLTFPDEANQRLAARLRTRT